METDVTKKKHSPSGSKPDRTGKGEKSSGRIAPGSTRHVHHEGAAGSSGAPDFSSAVRCMRIEIFGFGGSGELRKERFARWRDLAVSSQRMLNMMWQIWLCHHSNNYSAVKLQVHFYLFAQWKAADKATRGPKPAWPVQACDKVLSNAIYHAISNAFPEVNCRTRVLLQNKWQATLGKRKAASGNLPGWVAILFANESIPSFTKPQPIPFDKENGKLSERDGKQYLTLRIERLADGKSVVEVCDLMTQRRKAASARMIVSRCISGEYAFKGSSLAYQNGKWFALISYQRPIARAAGLDPDKTMVIVPGRRLEAKGKLRPSPWVLAIGANRWRFGGNGNNIASARSRLLMERAARASHYRWGGSAQKGRGRKRAEAVWTKLSDRWKCFVKRYNQEIARRVVDMCVTRKVGKLVYRQPRDAQRDHTLLARAGNRDDSRMTWDWFQMGTLLASACELAGVEFEKRESKAAQADEAAA